MVRKLLLVILFAVTLFIACKKDGMGPQLGRDDTAFNTYKDHFLADLWKLNPDWATSVGYHQYDSLLIVPNEKSRDNMLRFIRLQNDSLARFDAGKLSPANQIDHHIIQNQVEYADWKINTLKSYQWDPSGYNVISTFAYILNGHYAPLNKRLRNFYEKMDNIPAYYKEAEKQIKNPVPELTDLAIDQHLGGASVFEKDLADSLKRSTIPAAEQKKITDRAAIAVTSIKGYAAWLKALKNDHPRSFRLGKDLYEDKFKYEIQSAYNAQQMFNAANDRKKFIHREMAKLSHQLWPKYFDKKKMPADSLELISKVLDTLSGKHATAAGFQTTIENHLAKLTAFVKTKDLLTLDPGKPLLVRKEPAYMAGVAVASVSAPGPYDKKENTYYNVGSLAGWSAEKTESFLREYNQYTIQLLDIHEAIPGHYVQLVYANNTPSLIPAIFSNGAMVEGWAVYGEQMMLDNGYNNEPELKLMWYKWHLRSVCNMILDFAVHANGMTKEQAIKLLVNEAFQQQAEAEGKWKRVTLSSVQLDSYYIGFKEIMDLRDAYKTKMGDKYNLKTFNEKFLSYGSAPVKYIKIAMGI